MVTQYFDQETLCNTFSLDTIYIDFAKHAEDRVPKLKTLFRYIYEKASWYRPSLAVFDNLDKLLSPELEVGFSVMIQPY